MLSNYGKDKEITRLLDTFTYYFRPVNNPDGSLLYLGSANFTGAGLGAKGESRRNFEAGILTDDDGLLDELQAGFQAIWSGAECPVLTSGPR